MYTVTVNFFRSKHTVDFTLNIEAVSIDTETLLKTKDKTVLVYYHSDFANNLSDIYYNGKSLSGEYAPELNKKWKKVTGTLSGAENLSGDLPSKIYITNSEGRKLEFDWFVDDKVLAINNKVVTAYYTSRVKNEIKHIVPSNE